MRLQFSDGVEIETGGDLRVIRLADGLYVTGGGVLIPVRDLKEANEMIAAVSTGQRRGSTENNPRKENL